MLVLSLGGWRDQYDRMQRAYAKVQHTACQSSIEYDDDVVHFFEDCWHLLDWILYDPALAFSDAQKQAIRKECDKHKALRITADLANGQKHFVRTQRTKEGAKVTSKRVVFDLGRGDLTVTHEVQLDDGTVTTVQAAAADACAAWDAVLATLGLLIPQPSPAAVPVAGPAPMIGVAAKGKAGITGEIQCMTADLPTVG